MRTKGLLLMFIPCFVLISCRHASVNVQGPSNHNLAGDSLAKKCAASYSGKFGTPVMFNSSDSLVYGLSVNAPKAKIGLPVLLNVWVANNSDKTAVVSSCALDSLPEFGFHVYGADGQRVLSRREREAKQKSWNIPNNPPCLRNIAIPIQPHTCVMPRIAINLSEIYDFAVGEYMVRFRDGSLLGGKFIPVGNSDGVPVSIEPQQQLLHLRR